MSCSTKKVCFIFKLQSEAEFQPIRALSTVQWKECIYISTSSSTCLVLSLCVPPVGALSKVMVTMTTLMADLTPSQRSPNQLTIDKSSFILKESTDANSSICCCNNECYHSSNVLCTIPTSIFHKTEANAIANLLNDDDDNNPHENEQEDFSTFLQEWDDFYNEFINSTTYALAHSSTDSLMPSPIIDNDDDDRSMSECSDQPMTTNSFDDSLQQLCQAVRELEKVNYQFLQHLESLESQAPCLQLLHPANNTMQQQPWCQEPQHDCTLQYVLLQVLPPAPNRNTRPQQPPTQQQASQIDCSPCTDHGIVPCIPHLKPTTVPCTFPQPPSNYKHNNS